MFAVPRQCAVWRHLITRRERIYLRTGLRCHVQGEEPIRVSIQDSPIRIVISQLPASVPAIFRVDGRADMHEVGKLVNQYTGTSNIIVVEPEPRAEPYGSGDLPV